MSMTDEASGGYVDADKPLDEGDYRRMKADLRKYGLGSLEDELEREDRAFLLYQIHKYETSHGLELTASVRFTEAEVAWWHRL